MGRGGRWALYLSIYVVICGIAFALVLAGEQQREHLADHAISATATVTDSEPANHNLIRFTYVVRDKHYSGDNGPNENGIDPYAADQFPVGSQIQIVYDASDPEVYCPCPAADLQPTEAPLVAVVPGVMIIGAFPFVLVWAILSRELLFGT